MNPALDGGAHPFQAARGWDTLPSGTWLIGLSRGRRGKACLLPAAGFLEGNGRFSKWDGQKDNPGPRGREGGARPRSVSARPPPMEGGGELLWTAGGQSRRAVCRAERHVLHGTSFLPFSFLVTLVCADCGLDEDPLIKALLGGKSTGYGLC